MKLLLDTHTLIWAADDTSQIPAAAMSLMANVSNERLVSIASIWEISIKVGLGRLPLSLPFRPWIDKAIADLGLVVLPITLDHAERQAGLSWHHRDPFDRLLAAQAIAEGTPLVSADVIFDQYGINRIWQ
ncbi:MAG TPA: type II toxin-antitoxin system VapC family toxin [Fimbriiglobus sp.]|nr:type II toxin-antitoxin system VapC family toxin [Fimbriiglobus sp.]